MCYKNKVKAPTPSAPSVSAPSGSPGSPTQLVPNAVDNNAKGKKRLTINTNSVGTGVNL